MSCRKCWHGRTIVERKRTITTWNAELNKYETRLSDHTYTFAVPCDCRGPRVRFDSRYNSSQNRAMTVSEQVEEKMQNDEWWND